MAHLLDEMTEEVFLQGLACSRRPSAKLGMDLVRHVFDLHAGHKSSVAPIWRLWRQYGATIVQT